MLLQGCEVLTCSRDIGPLAELLKREARCVAISADVSTAEGRARVLEIVHKKFSGKLDILVNNVSAWPQQHPHARHCRRLALVWWCITQVGTNIRKHSSEYKDSYALDCARLPPACHACMRRYDRFVSCMPRIPRSEYDFLTATNQSSAFHLSRACFGALRRFVRCGLQ